MKPELTYETGKQLLFFFQFNNSFNLISGIEPAHIYVTSILLILNLFFIYLIIHLIYFQVSNRNSHTKQVNTFNFFFNLIINSFDFFSGSKPEYILNKKHIFYGYGLYKWMHFST